MNLPWGENHLVKTEALLLADFEVELDKYRGIKTEILQSYEWVVDFKDSHAKIDLVLYPVFDGDLNKNYHVLIGYKVFTDEQLRAAENDTQRQSEQKMNSVEVNTQSRYTDSKSIKKVQEYLRILGYYKGDADGILNNDTEVAIFTQTSHKDFCLKPL